MHVGSVSEIVLVKDMCCEFLNFSLYWNVCRWRMAFVCVVHPLIPAPSQRRRPWSSTWILTATQSSIGWRWVQCVPLYRRHDSCIFLKVRFRKNAYVVGFKFLWMHIALQDLLFSACGLSILSTIICTLSTVTCSIHIFSLDLVHLVSADTAYSTFNLLALLQTTSSQQNEPLRWDYCLHLKKFAVQMLFLISVHVSNDLAVSPTPPTQLAPHRSRSVNPECTTPQDAFLTNIMDFEEFVPPIPPPPYYPPEYTCSSETDAQR